MILLVCARIQPLRGPRGKASHCLSAFCSSLPTTQAMLARPPDECRTSLTSSLRHAKSPLNGGLCMAQGFCRNPKGVPAAKLRIALLLSALSCRARGQCSRDLRMNAGLLLPLLCAMQKGSTVVLPSAGAEKRIRTSGRVTPVTRFPIVLLKPLRHLCKRQELFYNKSAEKATAFRAILQNFRLDRRKFSHCPSPTCTPHGNMIQ